MGTSIKATALLIVMTTIFAGLALDIAMPALVLSIMALARWMVSLQFASGEPGGQTA